jgi:hypothetical protein
MTIAGSIRSTCAVVAGILADGMQGVQNDGEGQQASTTKTTLTGGDIDDRQAWREATNANKSLSII